MNFSRPRLLLAAACVVALLCVGVFLIRGFLHPSPPTLQVWRGGVIHTLGGEQPLASALVLGGTAILAVGSDTDVEPWVADADVVVELGGRTVVPGFIEAHGHFPGAGLGAVAADLNSPPIGTVQDVAQALEALREVDAVQPGDGWLIGFGYDDTMLAERRHLTRVDLDAVSTARPVLAMHISAHMVVVNSLALELLGIDAGTPDPSGGEIRRDRATGAATGLLLETAAREPMLDALDLPLLQQLRVIRSAVQTYAGQGFTTVQNGLANRAQIGGLSMGSRLGLIPQRVVVWPKDEVGMAMIDGSEDLDRYESDRLLIGAVKLVADGLIQGYTGYLRDSYHDVGEYKPGFSGYPSLLPGELNRKVRAVHCAGRQLAVHANGDAAIDMVLDAQEAALEACPATDPRTILVHAQMARPDQLMLMRELGVTPSFFQAHVYYWGDRHRDVFLGPARARRISPLAGAASAGLRYTTHLDTPVVPLDSMLQLWTPVARRTSGGAVLGAEERVSPGAALRAMTIDAAWQLGMEDSIGSIEVGKQADLVVLSGDPLSVADPRELHVQRTVVAGVTIFER